MPSHHHRDPNKTTLLPTVTTTGTQTRHHTDARTRMGTASAATLRSGRTAKGNVNNHASTNGSTLPAPTPSISSSPPTHPLRHLVPVTTATPTTLAVKLRLAILAFLTFAALVYVASFFPPTAEPAARIIRLVTASRLCPHLTPRMRRQRLRNIERLRAITRDYNEIMYFPQQELLFHLTLKGGTVALLEWMYRGLTNDELWQMEKCKTYIQNLTSPCWKGMAKFGYQLSDDELWHAFTSSETLRIATQRDPYERLISAFKSKYTCEQDRFHSDISNREFVHQLRQHANVSSGKDCMTIEEYAHLLDLCRINEATIGGLPVRFIETHIRPQELFFDEIDYGLVLDARNFSNAALMKPIFDKMIYKDGLEGYVPIRHSSGESKLVIPPESDTKLRAFAALSNPKMGEIRNCVG